LLAESRSIGKYKKFQEQNQICETPLTRLKMLNVLNNFPVEPQHAVYLGVTRKLFHKFFTTKPGKYFSLTKSVSDLIDEIKQFVPSDFQRKPRRIDKELLHFRATEFRLFYCTLGPLYLKSFYLNNFISNSYCSTFLYVFLYVFIIPTYKFIFTSSSLY